MIRAILPALVLLSVAVPARADLACDSWDPDFWRQIDTADIKRCATRSGWVRARLDETGLTRLHIAAMFGKPKTIKALVDAGANLDAEYRDDRTPLHFAAAGRSPETVSVLVDAGADIHARSKSGGTPLHTAAEDGTTEIVKAIVNAGADIHARDEGGRTPLHMAALKGTPETVKALLDAGANPKARALEKVIPADLAEKNEQIRNHTIVWKLNEARFR